MLRGMRENAGKTRKDAADWLEVGEPTVSKIELGRQAIKAPNVRLLCQLYDVDAGTGESLLRLAREANQRGWWTAYRDTLPEWFRQFVGLEGDAVEFWEYQSEFVPGLLQTRSYIEAITTASRPDIGDDELAKVVRVRRERQALLEGAEPPRLNVYLNEAVLRRVVGGPQVMREQLDQLVAASREDRTRVRVVPFSAGAHAAMASSFVLMQFPDDDSPAFAYIENDRGAVYQEDPGDIDRYTVMLDQLAEVSMGVAESRAALDEAARSLHNELGEGIPR
ncbi:helix-turn-helix domain-containing protein [Saccharopolyspora sp. HNM0986]|uniref:helix-turn-helix domain-containing protein n=1 Tax=Saccharopolyspora galaxeae TaxID=2781241 RepID=UPI002108374C|nr:helix-turn-helix transcriptional regulator [Saccharopolyspora sp. HNM0986]MBK0866721.1 helix-turn-helix domain-containing protein [Saccharopolyspora sp. HNM0986]